ncbi:thioesterase II family protein [Streptomyces sp. I05A-00742]|uniref:thioesterase II family protein n=1 Tax=Streptomyces sp. I05A-00742 TaxID=2732853 RepID=UPI001488BEFD|nr:alpha/beta fold hydrolase [Streptomyces sp. I05A-00742]
MTTAADELWFRRLSGPPAGSAALGLLCFPSAGAGPEAFRQLTGLLPDIALWAVHLPGRGTRLGEEPRRSLDELAEEIAGHVVSWAGGAHPYAVLGHSMGAALAYAVCVRLALLPVRQPCALVACARDAPGRPRHRRPVSHLPTPLFVEHLRRMGGTPAEVLDDPGVFAVFEPMLRADFAAAEHWRPRPAPPLGCPIAVVGSRDDPETRPAGLAAWHDLTSSAGSLDWVPGGHFFPNSHPRALAEVLNRRLPLGQQSAGLGPQVESRF